MFLNHNLKKKTMAVGSDGTVPHFNRHNRFASAGGL